LNSSILRRLPLILPPLPEQQAIASVLSSLDDKIDLLNRQNKTLEAMAETLFRQWFVEEVQEDWEKVTLDEVTTRITDGAHLSPPSVENGFPMASVKDMHQWGINIESCRKISESDFTELVRNDCRPLKNDIIIAKDGSYLKHVFVAENDLDVVVLSSIAILRPNEKYHPLLLATFLKIPSTREELENIVTGAVIPRIVLKDFRKFTIALPPQYIQDRALEIIEPIYLKCWRNVAQIKTLEKLRNTLLPKLMSGEVRVAV
jgi:type I restriction enzyme S subunit